MVAVKPVEAVLRTEPQEAVLVLYGAIDRAVGKAVLYLEMPEIIGLCVCPGKADDKQ
jgi:hypothetical protein